jgi:aminopeptidase N
MKLTNRLMVIPFSLLSFLSEIAGATRAFSNPSHPVFWQNLFSQDQGLPIHDENEYSSKRIQSNPNILENHPRFRFLGFDVDHYDIKIKVDPLTSLVEGQVEIFVIAQKDAIRSLSFDAVDQLILKVADHQGRLLASQYNGALLKIDLQKALKQGEKTSVIVEYRALRPQSVKLTGPDATNPTRMAASYTYTQPEDTATWLPCVDKPDDKATMSIALEVPAGFKALSNGVSTEQPGTGLDSPIYGTNKGEIWAYRMDDPIAPYLISFAVGPYSLLSLGTYQGKALTLWAPPAVADKAFAEAVRTPQMMAIFSQFTGVDYPFTHYAQSVAETHGGSMEHQTATTMGGTRMSGDGSGESVVAHELAHQWFGDWVTCRTWGDLWLNEGFASYLPLVFYEEFQDSLQTIGHLDRWRKSYFSQAKNTAHPLSESHPDVNSIFDAHAYDKGALVIHMMRELSQSNQVDLLQGSSNSKQSHSPFTKALSLYLTRKAKGNVRSFDLQQALEDAVGDSYDWQLFFDQWVLSPGHPQIKVQSKIITDPEGKRQQVIQLTQTQLQRQSEKWRSFSLPLEVEVIDKHGRSAQHTLDLWDDITELKIPLIDDQSLAFNVNPRWSMLVELTQEQTRDQWLKILQKSPYATSRLVALRELSQLDIWNKDQDKAFAKKVVQSILDDKEMYLKTEALYLLISRANSQLEENFKDEDSSAQGDYLAPWIGLLTSHIRDINRVNPKNKVAGVIKQAELWLVQRVPVPIDQETKWQNDYFEAHTVAERQAILGMLHHGSVARAQEFMLARFKEPQWVSMDRLEMLKYFLKYKTPITIQFISEILTTSSSTFFNMEILGTMKTQKWQDTELVNPVLTLIKQHTSTSLRDEALIWLRSLENPPVELCQTLQEWMQNPSLTMDKIIVGIQKTEAAVCRS